MATGYNFNAGTQNLVQDVCDGDECPRIKLRALLEGAYIPENNVMTTTLSDKIPANQPFTSEPWLYYGSESRSVSTNNMVDWVLVDAYNLDNEWIGRKVGLLRKDGWIVDENGDNGLPFSELISGEAYRFIIRPRNHIAVMTQDSIVVPNIVPYDLSDPVHVKGEQQVKNAGNNKYVLVAGDINSDGIITVEDSNFIRSEISLFNNYFDSDCNFDKAVTIADFNLYRKNISRIGIPEVRY